MGQDSHYTSNLRVLDYDITGVATVTATNITGAKLRANTYIQMGSHQYLMFGGLAYAASIAAVATAVDASCQGSLYISSDGTLFIMTSDTAASSIPTN